MNKFKLTVGLLGASASLVVLLAGCQKMDRPALGDYVKDSNPPGGPLAFYVAFDGSSTDALMNGVDSVKANFPQENPLASIAGVSGKAAQGKDGKAVFYPSSNDFKNAKSFTMAMWLKNTAQAGRTEFLFSLVDPTYNGWSYSGAFCLVENQTATKTTMKFGLMDQWLEGDFNKPLFDGSWHHMVYVYDHTTSKMTYYFDGVVVTGMTATQTDVKKNGAPRGAVDFSQANKFIIGGWNKHGNASGPGDDWIKSYTGGIDQYRMYTSALTASEVLALYNSKK